MEAEKDFTIDIPQGLNFDVIIIKARRIIIIIHVGSISVRRLILLFCTGAEPFKRK